MKIGEILSWLRSIAPEETAMAGDPVGLLVQPSVKQVSRVIVALDATPHVADAAAQTGAELVVCHHPLIYRPLAALIASEPVGHAVLTFAREGVAVYAMHTNWDVAEGGINDTLAKKLGMRNVRPLGLAAESRIPRIGAISPAPLHALASSVSAVLDTTGENALRYSQQFSERIVKTLAVCGGAGASFLKEALDAGADALLTADVRHHEFVDAESRGAALIDAGHGATEKPGMAALASRMQEQFPDLTVSYLDS